MTKLVSELHLHSLKWLIGSVYLSMLLLISTGLPLLAEQSNITNNNNNNLENTNLINNALDNNVQLNVSNRSGAFGSVGSSGGAGVPGGGIGTVVSGAPAHYAMAQPFNAPWNFTSPNTLFHCSKLINDSSMFSKCRLINVDTPLRTRFKDKFLGVFDDRRFVASGLGGARLAPHIGPAVVACSPITPINPCCSQFLGSGYVSMEEYATNEEALVGLSQIAAKNGANLVGNINCGFGDGVRSSGLGLGASVGYNHSIDNDNAIGTTLGATWNTALSKRTAQPFCTGDFYLASLQACNACAANTGTIAGQRAMYMHKPIAYRRYLPPAPPRPMPPPAKRRAAVRGLW